ncbi:hypothetical protein AG1IA_08155 [Rhizoctonia solani AG-1 IA]|uniref:Uncharacterized protein n=1 Tax=Thanatephorus cucumeris (strain AG1-IA) TaxID=983506 RepID=L8WIU5_THACA|nr:hypothetical protein AG1IA_08155 [Rhizoctonia solani AG-1 IA]
MRAGCTSHIWSRNLEGMYTVFYIPWMEHDVIHAIYIYSQELLAAITYVKRS